jgi:hypothetical protein
LEKWQPVFAKHENFSRPDGQLNPKSDAKLPKEFTYVRDLLASRLGAAGRPSDDRLRALEVQIAGWATAVKTSRSACFRINLGYQALKTIHELGGPISAPGKDAFCDATAGTDLPTVDHYCGRQDLGAYVNAFHWDEWEFRHQRCPGWESADGKPGLATPGLDLAEALKEKYAL